MSKEIAILNEITSACENCNYHENCLEDDCALYRIEKIVEGVNNESWKN